MPRFTLTTTRMEMLYAGDHASLAETLERAVSQNIRIIDMDLRHMDLRGITLDGGQFHNCLFDDSNLEGANLSECTFTLCDFRRSNLTDACFCYSDVIACRLDKANVSRADFAECFLLHSVLPANNTRQYDSAYAMQECVFINPINVKSHNYIPKSFYKPLQRHTPLRTSFSRLTPILKV